MAKGRFRTVTGLVHLWLGLLTSLVVFIVSITGTLYVFDEELFRLFHSDLYHLKPTRQPLNLSELRTIAQQAIPGKKITSVEISGDPADPYLFMAQQIAPPEKAGLTYFSQLEYWDDVFIDPYRGTVLGVVDRKFEFFNLDRQLHQHVLLVKPIGSFIVGGSTLIFMVMLLTGFVLWVPRQWKNLKNRLTVKTSGHWKRLNYDLHNTLGFYILPIALFIAVTGLVWSFKWWEGGIYRLMGAKKKPAFGREYKTPSTQLPRAPAEDLAFSQIRHFVQDQYKIIGINYTDKADKPLNCYCILRNNSDGWRGFSYFFFDSRTGEFFDRIDHEKKPLAMKWRNSNLDLHTGRIYGWPTQILFVIISLISASLPVTGFLIWWGKRKKKSGSFKSKRPKSSGLLISQPLREA